MIKLIKSDLAISKKIMQLERFNFQPPSCLCLRSFSVVGQRSVDPTLQHGLLSANAIVAEDAEIDGLVP